jgi:hypothetical protein
MGREDTRVNANFLMGGSKSDNCIFAPLEAEKGSGPVDGPNPFPTTALLGHGADVIKLARITAGMGLYSIGIGEYIPRYQQLDATLLNVPPPRPTSFNGSLLPPLAPRSRSSNTTGSFPLTDPSSEVVDLRTITIPNERGD